jgi:hypothetical protein
VIPLRPLTLGELLDGAVSVIRRYPRPALGISAVVALVTTLVNLAFVLTSDLSSFAADLRSGDQGDTSFGAGFSSGFGAGTGGPGATLAGGLVSYLAGLVLTGALVVVVGKAVLGRPTTFGDVWTEVRPRLLALLGLSLVTGFAVGAPAVAGVLLAVLLVSASGAAGAVVGVPLGIAGVVGSVYLYTRFSLAPAVLVLEKAGIRTALRRSGALVRNSWLRVFGILVLASIITSLVAGVLGVPFTIVGGIAAFTSDASTASVTLLLVLTQIGSGLAAFLVSPFSAGVRALLYVDRRMRAEGLDLTLQAAAAQGPAQA